jgi:hypothetical protein
MEIQMTKKMKIAIEHDAADDDGDQTDWNCCLCSCSLPEQSQMTPQVLSAASSSTRLNMGNNIEKSNQERKLEEMGSTHVRTIEVGRFNIASAILIRACQQDQIRGEEFIRVHFDDISHAHILPAALLKADTDHITSIRFGMI